MKVWISVVVILIMLFPVSTIGKPPQDSIQGEVKGYTCLMEKRSCAKSPDDPVALTEDCYVIVEPGGKYYFVPNVDCRILAAYVTETVKVTGKLDPKNPAIRADRIEVIKDGKSRLVWNRLSGFNPMK